MAEDYHWGRAQIRPHSDIHELIGQMMDVFEDFLSRRNEDKSQDDIVMIEGEDYDELSSDIADTLVNWGIIIPLTICGQEDCEGCLLQHVDDIESCKEMRWE